MRACRPVLRSETLTSSLSRSARYGVFLEQHTFAGRIADFVWMIMLGIFVLLPLPLIVPSLGLPFLSSSLVFMLLYLWSRENPNANTSIMGFVTLKAFYLPWGMMAATAMMGGSVLPDFLGVIAGTSTISSPSCNRAQGDPTSSSPRRGSARCVSTPSEMRAPGAAVAAPACGDPPHARSPREEGADSAASSAATDESQPRRSLGVECFLLSYYEDEGGLASTAGANAFLSSTATLSFRVLGTLPFTSSRRGG